jgi:hypothetical protein
MDPGPLVKEQIDAGGRFLAELEKTVPVAAAFWLRRQDQDSFNFYVASDRFEHGDRDVARGEAFRVAWELRDPELDSLYMRLIKPSDPLVRAALDYQRLYPGKAIRLRDRVFGAMGIDEVYIYPSPIAVS